MATSDPRKEKIAKRFREARKLAGLSQGQTAAMMGWHRPTVSQIEAGDRNLTSGEAAEIARIFDVSFTWLLAEVEEPSGTDDARVLLAARELNKLKPEELDRLMRLLAVIRLEGLAE